MPYVIECFRYVSKNKKLQINNSMRKPNEIWVDKGSEDDDIEMHSTHNEEKSAIAETFIRTIKEQHL